MSYIITRQDGTVLCELQENVIDTSKAPVSLIGKLSPDYGSYQSNNFVHILENFSDIKFPSTPLLGMTCYRKDDKSLYMCVDEQSHIWVKLMAIRFSDDSNPQTGDFWYNKDTKQLFIFDSLVGSYGEWILIGPENFFNKENQNIVLKTDNQIQKSQMIISLDEETTSLLTIKVVGKEYIDRYSAHPKVGQQPETMAMIIRVLVNSYRNASNILLTNIIGEPSYEIIGRTNGEALNWSVIPSIFENTIKIEVDGIGTPLLPENARGWVNWELDVEIVKV